MICKPAYSEPVSKPGIRDGCSRNGMWHGSMAYNPRYFYAIICVAAAGLLVVIQ